MNVVSTLQEKHGNALLASTGCQDKAVSVLRAHEKYAGEIICMDESNRAKYEMCGGQMFARWTDFQKIHGKNLQIGLLRQDIKNAVGR
jgi:hypothetical protein